MAIDWSGSSNEAPPLENYLAFAQMELNQRRNTETQHIPLQACTNAIRIDNEALNEHGEIGFT